MNGAMPFASRFDHDHSRFTQHQPPLQLTNAGGIVGETLSVLRRKHVNVSQLLPTSIPALHFRSVRTVPCLAYGSSPRHLFRTRAKDGRTTLPHGSRQGSNGPAHPHRVRRPPDPMHLSACAESANMQERRTAEGGSGRGMLLFSTVIQIKSAIPVRMLSCAVFLARSCLSYERLSTRVWMACGTPLPEKSLRSALLRSKIFRPSLKGRVKRSQHPMRINSIRNRFTLMERIASAVRPPAPARCGGQAFRIRRHEHTA